MSNVDTARRSFALGAFVVFQLLFLILHNLFTVLQDARSEMAPEARAVVEQFAPGWPESKGHLSRFMEGTTNVTNRYAQATLQLQSWSLFAPNVGTVCVFPALLLSDEPLPDAPVHATDAPGNYDVRGKIVLSDNEPADMTRYFRWGSFRLRRLENNLVVYLSPDDSETAAAMAERFRERIKSHVAEYDEALLAYLRWRLKAQGAAPPRQVILLMRRYSLKGPNAGANFFEGPFTMPVVRWQPQAPVRPARQALEYFNPVTQRFESL
ncbi:MAG: hypothetical protein L0Y71_05790 [Gemmataceae bacterium]|nr:hypothetical protein [Gemmataceae bacterium]